VTTVTFRRTWMARLKLLRAYARYVLTSLAAVAFGREAN
jgi:hypothetical protein